MESCVAANYDERYGAFGNTVLAPVYHAGPVIIRRLIALQLTGSKFSPDGTLVGTGGNSWTVAMVDVGQSTLAIPA